MTGRRSPSRPLRVPGGLPAGGRARSRREDDRRSLEEGLSGFLVLVVIAAAMLYRARRDRLRGHASPWRDERSAMIDKRAMAIGAMVAFAVTGGAWLVEIAKGQDGTPYVQIVLVGIAAQVIAVVVLHLRS